MEKPEHKPWMKSFGALRHLHEENVRIQRIIDEEFEQIEPEDWEDIDPTAPSQSRLSNER
jgi:hypothetical protein